jgi:hypothetical protein
MAEGKANTGSKEAATRNYGDTLATWLEESHKSGKYNSANLLMYLNKDAEYQLGKKLLDTFTYSNLDGETKLRVLSEFLDGIFHEITWTMENELGEKRFRKLLRPLKADYLSKIESAVEDCMALSEDDEPRKKRA